MGDALAENKRLETIILRENRIKWFQYANFWQALMPNKTLQKLNLQKTDMSDKVIDKMGQYLKQKDIMLKDLDLSRNHISDVGLKTLSLALK